MLKRLGIVIGVILYIFLVLYPIPFLLNTQFNSLGGSYAFSIFVIPIIITILYYIKQGIIFLFYWVVTGGDIIKDHYLCSSIYDVKFRYIIEKWPQKSKDGSLSIVKSKGGELSK